MTVKGAAIEGKEDKSMTISELLWWARRQLGNIDTSMIDAEVLLSCATKKSRASLFADASWPVPESQLQEFKLLLERRLQGEPVAYLTGKKEFWSLMLSITSDVLIPRPETELLVEQVLSHSAGRDVSTILELGTGSGAIALALASELPQCNIMASDISSAAIELAKLNQENLKVPNIEFCCGDWFNAVTAQRFDIIVSNPPYVAPEDEHLSQGALRYEPQSALISQCDGLADLELIIQQAPGYLNDDGLLLLEHGYDQSCSVHKLFAGGGYTSIITYQDLSGNDRMTSGSIYHS